MNNNDRIAYYTKQHKAAGKSEHKQLELTATQRRRIRHHAHKANNEQQA